MTLVLVSLKRLSLSSLNEPGDPSPLDDIQIKSHIHGISAIRFPTVPYPGTYILTEGDNTSLYLLNSPLLSGVISPLHTRPMPLNIRYRCEMEKRHLECELSEFRTNTIFVLGS